MNYCDYQDAIFEVKQRPDLEIITGLSGCVEDELPDYCDIDAARFAFYKRTNLNREQCQSSSCRNPAEKYEGRILYPCDKKLRGMKLSQINCECLKILRLVRANIMACNDHLLSAMSRDNYHDLIITMWLNGPVIASVTRLKDFQKRKLSCR